MPFSTLRCLILMTAATLMAQPPSTAFPQTPGGSDPPLTEAISRAVTVINTTPAFPQFSEAVSRAYTVTNLQPTNPEVREVVSRAATVRNNLLLLESITPDHGGDTGQVTATIRGRNLDAGATAVLAYPQPEPFLDTPAIVGRTTGWSLDGTRLTVTFDLAGAARGVLNVVVTNPDRRTAGLPLAFTIEEGRGPELWLDLIGQNVLVLGRLQQFYLLVGNRGNVDSTDEQVIAFVYPDTMEITVPSLSGPYGQPVEPVTSGAGILTGLVIPLISADSTSQLPLNVSVTDPSESAYIAVGFVSEVFWVAQLAKSNGLEASIGSTVSQQATEEPPVGASVFLGADDSNSYGHQAPVSRENGQIVVWDHFLRDRFGYEPIPFQDWLAEWRRINPNVRYLGGARPPGWPPAGGEQQFIVAARTFYSMMHPKPDPVAGKDWPGQNRFSCAGGCEQVYELVGINPNPQGQDPWILFPSKNYRGWSGRWDFFPLSEQGLDASAFNFGLDFLVGFAGSLGELLSRLVALVERSLPIVRAIDPNEKVGSPRDFLSAQEPLRYTVYFENDPERATAAAQDVVVTDRLNIGLVDPSSLQLHSLQFAGNVVTVEMVTTEFSPCVRQFTSERVIPIDLSDVASCPVSEPIEVLVRTDARANACTGEMRIELRTFDPVTGDRPTNPCIGFLPPNQAPPEGEGSVTFTVFPKTGAKTGTEICNTAEIVFDANDPITACAPGQKKEPDCPGWCNTIDADPPTSGVEAVLVEGTCPPEIELSWSGADQENGSGLRSYSVFESRDGGAFVLFVANATEASAVYTAKPGHTYVFYTRAMDNVGNIEDAPAEPDALVVTPIPADLTKDAVVNLADWAALLQCMGQACSVSCLTGPDPGAVVTDACRPSDLDCNGVVDLRDAALFQRAIGSD